MMKNNNTTMISLCSFYAKCIFLTLAFTASIKGAEVKQIKVAEHKQNILVFGHKSADKDVLLASLIGRKDTIKLDDNNQLKTGLECAHYQLYEYKKIVILNTKSMSNEQDSSDVFNSALADYPIKGFVLVVHPFDFVMMGSFLTDLAKMTKFFSKDYINHFAGKIKLVVYMQNQKEGYTRAKFSDCMRSLYNEEQDYLGKDELEKIKAICKSFYKPNNNFATNSAAYFVPHLKNVIFTNPVYVNEVDVKISNNTNKKVDQKEKFSESSEEDKVAYKIAYSPKYIVDLGNFMQSFPDGIMNNKMFNLAKEIIQ